MGLVFKSQWAKQSQQTWTLDRGSLVHESLNVRRQPLKPCEFVGGTGLVECLLDPLVRLLFGIGLMTSLAGSKSGAEKFQVNFRAMCRVCRRPKLLSSSLYAGTSMRWLLKSMGQFGEGAISTTWSLAVSPRKHAIADDAMEDTVLPPIPILQARWKSGKEIWGRQWSQTSFQTDIKSLDTLPKL